MYRAHCHAVDASAFGQAGGVAPRAIRVCQWRGIMSFNEYPYLSSLIFNVFLGSQCICYLMLMIKHICHHSLFISFNTSFAPGSVVKTRKLTYTDQFWSLVKKKGVHTQVGSHSHPTSCVFLGVNLRHAVSDIHTPRQLHEYVHTLSRLALWDWSLHLHMWRLVSYYRGGPILTDLVCRLTFSPIAGTCHGGLQTFSSSCCIPSRGSQFILPGPSPICRLRI